MRSCSGKEDRLLIYFFFFLMIRRPRRSPLFPYPPLSRSRLVPEKNEVRALIADISTKAKVRGVTIGRIEPQPVEPGQPFDTYKYRLEIIGHYDQLGEFLSDIASLRRIIVPQDLSLKPAQQQAMRFLSDTLGALLEAQFAIRTFVKAAAPPPPPPGKKPAARPAAEPGGGGRE